MKEFWNTRYSQPEFAYGEEPNEFLKNELVKYTPGTILFPAEGEGRNAVYAAKLGWKVFAFDQSSEGKKKAELLAAQNNVSIKYEVGEFQDIHYQPEQFDAIALIYAHFPSDKKSIYHRQLSSYLRKGGLVLLEVFSRRHAAYNKENPGVGGPKDVEMLFSVDEIQDYFQDFEIVELKEQEIELNEGLYHNGKGSVIRFIGRKK